MATEPAPPGIDKAPGTSWMAVEAAEAAAAAARLLAAEGSRFEALAAGWQWQPPQTVVTVARGSSAHAAHYFAGLACAQLGRLVTPLPIALLTLHDAPLSGAGMLALAFSQSGRSPDLVAALQRLGEREARTVAVVNADASPLAAVAQQAVSLHAGPERSVAATKSCVCQFVAAAALVSAWRPEPRFAAALAALPQALAEAQALDWSEAVAALAPAAHLYVVGRGLGLAVAMEAALKFKEACGLHAEAQSAAELLHGPVALADASWTALVLAPAGPAQRSLLDVAALLRARGARVLLAAPPGTPDSELALAPGLHAALDPVPMLPPLHRLAEALARARGLDPDRPRHLQKVTLTG